MMKMKFHARRNIWGDRIELFAYTHGPGGERIVARPTQLEAIKPDDGIPDESPSWIDLDNDSAQQLMDELWYAGFRPTEGSGSAGSLAATERHLADMRSLVFKSPPSAA